MNTEIIIKALATVIVAVAAFSCAAYLNRFARERTKPSLPVTAILLIGVTALITGLQFIFPEVLTAFRRNLEALLAGEWWRMVTPLFVQAAGWPQAFINGVFMIILCPIAEKLYRKRLLALYFIPGVLGEIFGYLWWPNFAGSSLGIAGVMGSLFAFTFFHRREMSKPALAFAIVGIAGAVALCSVRDTHGPPILIGFLLARLMMM